MAHTGRMTSELVDDLKQFIEAAFVQHISGINTRFDTIEQRLNDYDQRFTQIDQRFDDVELKLDTVIDTFGEVLVDHGARLSKPEALKS